MLRKLFSSKLKKEKKKGMEQRSILKKCDKDTSFLIITRYLKIYIY